MFAFFGSDTWLGDVTPHVETTAQLPPVKPVGTTGPLVTMTGQQVGVGSPPDAAPLAPLEVTVRRSSGNGIVIGALVILALVYLVTHGG